MTPGTEPSTIPPDTDDDARATRAPIGRRALGMMRRTRGFNVGVAGALVVLIVVLWLTEDNFGTKDNLITVAETNATLLIVAVGLTFVMLAGGFDLSLGGMLALSGVLLSEFLESGLPLLLAIIVTVAIAAVIGLITTGFLVARVGLSFLVVTLGMASILRGVALVRTDGSTISLFQYQGLVDLGSERFLGIPYSVLIALVVFGLAALVLRFTGYGRMVYAVGGNPEAARLAGIPVLWIRFSVYGVAAALAALAGVLDVARLSSASPNAGTGIELNAAAAVLLGGTAFMGGRGGVVGTIIGVVFLGVLADGITLAGVQAFWQGIATGTVVVLALVFDRVTRPRIE